MYFRPSTLVAKRKLSDTAQQLAYISEFIEAAKASGLVQRAMVNSGWRGVHVALGYPATQEQVCCGDEGRPDAVGGYLGRENVKAFPVGRATKPASETC